MSKANKTADLVSQTLYGFKNKIVDGRFDFWYEGTSQTTGAYGSDTMWLNLSSGSTKTHSQQPLVAGVDLPAIDCPTAQYFSRTVVNSVAGASNYVVKWHKIENVATLAGKTVTLSFYAKADAVKSISLGFTQYFVIRAYYPTIFWKCLKARFGWNLASALRNNDYIGKHIKYVFTCNPLKGINR